MNFVVHKTPALLYSLIVPSIFTNSDAKAGIGIGASVLIFVAIAMAATFTADIEAEEKKMQKMSDEELHEISLKWKYNDLMTNNTGYQDELIYVTGKVIKYPLVDDYVAVETGCSKVLQHRDCDVIFIQTESEFKVNDKISGFVFVDGFHDLISKKPQTGALVGENVPNTRELRLTCELCSSIEDT